MIIHLESTSEIVTLDGAICRVWQGATEGGVPVTAFIARVAVPVAENSGQFERELLETRPPAPSRRRWPKRMVTP